MEAGPPETGAAQPETATADLVPRRGYQEYAIQQTPYEQPMKSSRYNISFFVILARECPCVFTCGLFAKAYDFSAPQLGQPVY